jgi:hypothetical protein
VLSYTEASIKLTARRGFWSSSQVCASFCDIFAYAEPLHDHLILPLVMVCIGKIPILLATDIAARGIHIANVNYVVNYDFPGSLDQVKMPA